MQKGNVFTVKVRLYTGGIVAETRMFRSEMADSRNYSSLRVRLECIFPRIVGMEYRLSWTGKFNLICVVSQMKQKILQRSNFMRVQGRKLSKNSKKFASLLLFKTSQTYHNSRDCYTSRFL